MHKCLGSHTQTDTSEIEKFGESFHAVNSWPLYWHAYSLSGSVFLSLSPTHISQLPAMLTGCVWRGIRMVCLLCGLFSSIHQHLLWIHHLFATGGSDTMNEIPLSFTVMAETFYIMKWALFVNCMVVMSFFFFLFFIEISRLKSLRYSLYKLLFNMCLLPSVVNTNVN